MVDTGGQAGRDWARPAGWLLAASGIASALGMGYLMTTGDTKTEAQKVADALSSGTGITIAFVYIVGLIALMFGLFALYGALRGRGNERLSLAGLAIAGIANGLLLAGFGAFLLASSVAADVYHAGHPDALLVLQQLGGGNFGRAVQWDYLTAMALGLIGAVLLGLAIARAGRLPRWSAPLVGAGLALLLASIPFVSPLGSLLLIVAGFRMARSPRAARVLAQPAGRAA